MSNDPLIHTVKKFVLANRRSKNPLLLALSGGTDSLALYHILLECLLELSMELHIAHVDHGWREESAREAEILQNDALAHGIPFHLQRLDPPQESKNLEEKARIQRLEFFQKISLKIDAQAVLLAHQFEDQAETVLKRVFEGSSSLGGMQPVSQWEQMTLWRPLLAIKKEMLKDWLEQRGLKGFEDKTNEDVKFLRSRMRKEIFPELNRLFGKSVQDNLYHLGTIANEWNAYLEKKISAYLPALQEGPFGTLLDLSPYYPLERVEIRALVKQLFDRRGVACSHSVLENLLTLLETKAANKKIVFKQFLLMIDRGRLFFMESLPPSFPFEGNLSSTRITKGDWEWEIECSLLSLQEKPRCMGWKEVWSGKASVFLPAGDYEFSAPKGSLQYPGATSIKKWWGENKVPAFITQSLPLISQKGAIMHEFFSGRARTQKKEIVEELIGFNIDIKIKNKNS